MDSNCPNCGNLVTCSCQLYIASDGATVCGSCMSFYEYNLKIINEQIKNQLDAESTSL